MNIILVDDHPLFREALRSMIHFGIPAAAIEEADSIGMARHALLARPRMDLIVLDLSMKGVSGFEGLLGLRASFPRVPILICSGLEEPAIIREALQLGAAGFVPKSAARATYLEAVERIMRGEIYVPSMNEPGPPRAASREAATRIATLTPAQMNVLGLIKRGLINKQIAYELGIGDSMVKAHVSDIMRKLGVRNRTQIALCATSLEFRSLELSSQ